MKLFRFINDDYIVLVLAQDRGYAWHWFDKRIATCYDDTWDFKEMFDNEKIDLMFEQDQQITQYDVEKDTMTYWSPYDDEAWETQKTDYYGHK